MWGFELGKRVLFAKLYFNFRSERFYKENQNVVHAFLLGQISNGARQMSDFSMVFLMIAVWDFSHHLHHRQHDWVFHHFFFFFWLRKIIQLIRFKFSKTARKCLLHTARQTVTHKIVCKFFLNWNHDFSLTFHYLS